MRRDETIRQAGERAATPAAAVAATSQSSPSLAMRFVDLVQQVPAVRHVAMDREGRAVYLWALTEEYDSSAVGQVHECVRDLYDEFPEIEFDILVVPLAGEDLATIVPTGFEIVWSRA